MVTEIGTSPDKEARIWAVICHMSTFLTPALANFYVPLIIWLLKRDEFPLVRDQGLEVLNFQITVVIYYAVAIVLMFTIVCLPLPFIVGFFHVILSIVGAIKAWDGVAYRYPLTLRLL